MGTKTFFDLILLSMPIIPSVAHCWAAKFVITSNSPLSRKSLIPFDLAGHPVGKVPLDGKLLDFYTVNDFFFSIWQARSGYCHSMAKPDQAL